MRLFASVMRGLAWLMFPPLGWALSRSARRRRDAALAARRHAEMLGAVRATGGVSNWPDPSLYGPRSMQWNVWEPPPPPTGSPRTPAAH